MAKSKYREHIGRDKLLLLGFKELERNIFVIKRGRTISATIALDDKGYLLNSTGLPFDKFGNLVLYRRY